MQESMQFKDYINTAIDCYVQDRQGKVSQERLNDIANIKSIIGGAIPGYSHHKQNLSKYLKKMRTGWFVFQTGNSKLKESIQSKIKEFKKRHTKVLLTPNGNIQLPNKEQVKKRTRAHGFGFFSRWGNTSTQGIKKSTNTSKKKENYIFRFTR